MAPGTADSVTSDKPRRDVLLLRKAVATYLFLVLGVLGLIGITGADLGFKLNLTASMPLGLWRVSPKPTTILRGTIVIACMDDPEIATMALKRGYISTGLCPTGSEPVLKPISAVAGDVVEVSGAGITINGESVPNSARLDRDPAGREMPAIPDGTYKVDLDTIWTVSGRTPFSFDSRYYGPVPTRSVIGVAAPVWVLP